MLFIHITSGYSEICVKLINNKFKGIHLRSQELFAIYPSNWYCV